MLGLAFTVTVDVPLLMQPFASVPVTVYTVVNAGEAVTVPPVAALRVPEGDHEYVAAPEPTRGKDPPAQIEPELAVTFGRAYTMMPTAALAMHPLLSTISTVYAVVEVGLTVGFELVIPPGVQL
jgi:hypothetical protein